MPICVAMANPMENRAGFGMLTNGSSTLFVKRLVREYGMSDVFGIRSQHRNNLYEILKILKSLGRAIIAE